MSANSLNKVYSRSVYSVYVGNSKASERGTAPLRAFISETNPKTGESNVIESFIGSSAELDAVKMVERLVVEREARLAAKRNPVKAWLNKRKAEKIASEKAKAEEAARNAKIKAKMDSEWFEND